LVRDRLENVEVLTQDGPPRGEPNLLGRYLGIPLTGRGAHYAGVLPETITLYRRTIERSARDEDEFRATIVYTIEPEVAHPFGISDARCARWTSTDRAIPGDDGSTQHPTFPQRSNPRA